MAPTKKLKAHELATMLAVLLNFDVNILARVANVPKRNLLSWLLGKKENLRLQSVMSLLSMLGLKFEGGIRLDDNRVHFWQIKDGLFSRRRSAYETLSKLSKLMSGCLITRIAPAKKNLVVANDYFMVSGAGVRIVIVVHKSIFKTAKIGPEVIKGASWRDDNEHHTIMTNSRLWAHVEDKDLTTHEFDRIFLQIEETVSWTDLSLIAREFGVVPQQLSDWIMEHYGDSSSSQDSTENGIDIDGGGRLLALALRKAA